MVDAIISVVLQQLASIIVADIQTEARLLFKGQEEVENLTTTLTAIKSVLKDAERKQVKENSVKFWLQELTDLSYDLDDVLDEWNTRIHAPNRLTPKRKLVSFSSLLWSPCMCFNKAIMFHDLGTKMNYIKRRLDVIDREKDKYDFALEGNVEDLERPETTSLVDISEICGRQDDMDRLVSKVCGDLEIENGPAVISIVGLGGMGKTTLAQWVFNDENVSSKFEHKIWVCVSERFSKMHIAKMIIEAVDVLHPCLFWPECQRQLKNCVEGKKFLLVLDDVWTDDFQMWEPIKIPLKFGAPGSRILVTTRKERVSRMMEAAYLLSLEKLSPVASWSLFSRFAFYGKSAEDRSNLKEIGKKIVEKCNGLPLAIKTVGSLLRFKETKQAWESVLDSRLWELEEVERGIFGPLLLSYYDLSSPMKQCFTYCAIFPKNHKIEKSSLIQQWIAQGYISPMGSVDMEQRGEEYFDHFVMHSFFHDLERDTDDCSRIICKMHDVVHDFAQFLLKNECFIVEVDENGSQTDPLRKGARHMTLLGGLEQMHSHIRKFRTLRTLHFLPKRTQAISSEATLHFSPKRTDTLLSDLFQSTTSLRTLNLSSTSVNKIPKEVGDVLHLRYLDLSCLDVEVLPDTLSKLYNLQTLNLSRCRRLQRLPGGLGNLINLRHLIIRETDCLVLLPRGIGGLINLRTLCKFIVSENKEGCNIKELRSLVHLRGHLEISGLEKATNADEVLEANLSNKQHIRSLDLVFSLGDEKVISVIEALQPHPNLEVLQIYDYYGSVLPSWITLLVNLRDLRLIRCANCLELPPLGRLPSLETLLIGYFNHLKKVGPEFLGVDAITASQTSTDPVTAFPKLKKLTFHFMTEWEDWCTTTSSTSNTAPATSSGRSETAAFQQIMPCLRSLSFYDCPKLTALPRELQWFSLDNMVISRCPILEQQHQPDSYSLT